MKGEGWEPARGEGRGKRSALEEGSRVKGAGCERARKGLESERGGLGASPGGGRGKRSALEEGSGVKGAGCERARKGLESEGGGLPASPGGGVTSPILDWMCTPK